MKSWRYRAKERARKLLAWGLAGLLLLSSGWAGDGIKELFEAWLNAEPQPALEHATVVGYVVVFALALWGSAWAGRRYLFPRTRFMKPESPDKREHLVLFLSNLEVSRGGYHDGVPDAIALSGDLDSDIQRLEDLKEGQGLKWQWEMPLRAIRHHVGTLKTITLICSRESLPQAPWFCSIVRGYTALRTIRVWVYGKENGRPCLVEGDELANRKLEGWDFEAFDDLSRALLQRLQTFRETGVNEQEIMIDFTGGQKVTSVVAAMVTINRKVKTQYVQTNSPWDVAGYDIQVGLGETGDLDA